MKRRRQFIKQTSLLAGTLLLGGEDLLTGQAQSPETGPIVHRQFP